MQPLTRTPGFLTKAHTSRAGRTGGELYHCKGYAPKAKAGQLQLHDRLKAPFRRFSVTGNDNARRTCVRDSIITAIIAAFSSGYTISDMSQSSDLIQSAQRTIRLEVEAVQGLLPHIDADF